MDLTSPASALIPMTRAHLTGAQVARTRISAGLFPSSLAAHAEIDLTSPGLTPNSVAPIARLRFCPTTYRFGKRVLDSSGTRRALWWPQATHAARRPRDQR